MNTQLKREWDRFERNTPRLPFVARIVERDEAVYQDVLVYLRPYELGVYEAEIKLPIKIKPSDIETDVLYAFNENGFEGRIWKIEYTFA